MLSYIFRKSLYGIVVLFLVVLTISSIIYLSPVDPAALTQGQRTDTQTICLLYTSPSPRDRG